MSGTPEPDVVAEIVEALERFSGGRIRDRRALALLLGGVMRSGRYVHLGTLAFRGAAVARIETVLQRQAPAGPERALLEREFAEALHLFHDRLAEEVAASDEATRAALTPVLLEPHADAVAALRALAADLAWLKDWERAENARQPEGAGA